jgi:cell division protein FtsQ
MKIYSELLKQLDSSGAHYSRDLSEVDVSDPDDVRVTVSDPKGAVLIHLRTPNFLGPFQVYIAHVQEWRSQYSPLESMDLRFEGQVIVNPDSSAAHAKGAVASPDATAQNASPADPAPLAKKSPSAKKAKKH